MKFRAIIRNLSVLTVLSASIPVWAQSTPLPTPSATTIFDPLKTETVTPTIPQAPSSEAPPSNTTVPSLPEATEPLPSPPKQVKKKGPTDGLKPGQYVWDQRDTYEGPLKIVTVLDIQRIYVFQNDKLIGFSTISAGKKGKETPTGYFNILQKNVDHKSNLYSNAPMPFMQRLTWDGIALHGGHIPGYPASHGCIRLPHAFAKLLFGITKLEQEVVVLKDTATPATRPAPKPVPVIDPVTPVPPVADPLTIPSASSSPPTKS